ncbi:MAG: hypothetical protein KGJ60_00840 [Verrucomicrobiota bacterium]|nr:hypothetical protein [Verrucomicrobiota bacterium]MDE3066074.1 hypothetical protein [Verrucomicrobiota bacterium]
MTVLAEHSVRPFQFERDTFAFPHELVWQYRFDPVTGAMTTFHSNPPPTYYHRCFVMARSTRQFFYHARFAPERPPVEPEVYRPMIRELVARNPRWACAASERVEIPGYEDLRSFSRAHEALLKAELGGPWQSYFLRSHWRMVFPILRRFQERMAQQLKLSLSQRGLSLVHLFRFPRITINHGVALYALNESEQTMEFEAYDPNIPEHPVKLVYERARRVFTFAPSRYWGGGDLNVVEIFCDWPY